MLDNLKHTIDLLSSFNWGAEMKHIVVSNTKTIEDLQREQMASGKDRNNKNTTLNGREFYSPYTERQKLAHGQGLGAIISRITGYQTGALYNKIKARIHGDEFEVESEVGYFDELLSRTGEQWVGLSPLQREKFAEEVTLPQIKEIFKAKTGFIITSK